MFELFLSLFLSFGHGGGGKCESRICDHRYGGVTDSRDRARTPENTVRGLMGKRQNLGQNLLEVR